jgi:hypothetical protein
VENWLTRGGSNQRHTKDRLAFSTARPCYPSVSHLATMGNTLSRESIAREVQAEIDKLQKILVLLGTSGHGVSVEKTATAEKPKRRWSAAARRKMAAAQKARWAKIKAAKK